MKLDYYLPPDDMLNASAHAVRAVEAGYDGFFTSEASHDPFLPLAAAASHNLELDYGTAIAVAFARSPMVTAMTAWDLAKLTQGRFLLGIGTQVKAHIIHRFATEWGAPGPRLREYVQALRAIWTCWQQGTKLDFRGDFYSFRLMTPFFDPGPIEHPQIPVWIAGVGPYMARVAGEVCEGLHVHPLHTVRYIDEVVRPNIDAGAQLAARAAADVQLSSTVFVVTGRTEEEMEASRARTAQQIAFYASTPTYRAVLDLHGWDVGPTLSAMSKRGRWDEMAAVIPDQMIEEIAVVAPIADVGRRIRERYGGRLDRIGFYGLGLETTLTNEEWGELVAATRGA